MAAMSRAAYERRTLSRLGDWLTKRGHAWQNINRGIMVDTPYEGIFPPRSVYALHDEIAQHVSRMRCDLVANSHPMRVCIYIEFEEV